jgi:uridine kinase
VDRSTGCSAGFFSHRHEAESTSYYDWQRLREVLTTIRAGRATTFEACDWHPNQLSTSSKTIAGARLAVVEGLFAARPELADLIDISVLVESPQSIRAARRTRRRER